MNVEAQESQARSLPSLSRQCECRRRHDNREWKAMQGVMVGRKPFERMTRVTRQIFGNDSKAVNIRDDASQSDQSAYPATQRRRVGEDPSGKKVSDWTHVLTIRSAHPHSQSSADKPPP